jgi:hypothetical protein
VKPAAAARVVAAVVVHPSLWLVALRQWRRTTPHGWWKHAPFLPLPSGDYVRFRLVTQYGSVDHRIEPVDVLNYLSWCKQQDHAA